MGNDTLSPPPNQSTLFFSSLDSITLQVPNAVSTLSREQAHLIAVPNPADQEVVLQCNVSGECTLTDVTGRCWYRGLINSSSLHLNTSHLPNGIYFLQHSTASAAIKICVQH